MDEEIKSTEEKKINNEYNMLCNKIERILENLDKSKHIMIFNSMRKEFGDKFIFKSTNSKVICKSTDFDNEMLKRLDEMIMEAFKKGK
jgi:DNA gyrase/topoisomerase IV subunit A